MPRHLLAENTADRSSPHPPSWLESQRRDFKEGQSSRAPYSKEILDLTESFIYLLPLSRQL